MKHKYRVWSESKGQMGEVLALYWRDGEIFSALVDFGDHRTLCQAGEMVLMQGTGLKDKSGIEIFDGDILNSEYTDLDPNNKNCHPVAWRSGQWICEHSVNDCCKAWRGNLSGHHTSENVIGNIYQNKDLIS